MTTINMLEAKSQLSRLVQAVESGEAHEIIIARNGRPAARLVPVARPANVATRLGLLAGRFPTLSQQEFDQSNDDIDTLFHR